MRGPRRWVVVAGVLSALGLFGSALRAQETRSAAAAAPDNRAHARRHRRLAVDPPLPAEQRAGVIPRPAFNAVLASGIPRFLQQVRTEPDLLRGRFVGWRVLALFPQRSDIRVQGVRPGDTVTRVNGQSIERPEQLMKLWQSLAGASELVVDIERNGQSSRLRYTIQS